MTFRNAEPWLSEEDLVLTKTLPERILYVRLNLLDEDGQPLTQPEFAKALGRADGHHGVMAWEKHGREPQAATRKRLAALTSGAYRPEVFSRAGAEAIVVESAVPRLQSLQAEADLLRSTLVPVLAALAAAGIQVQLPEAATRSLATASPASQTRTEAR